MKMFFDTVFVTPNSSLFFPMQAVLKPIEGLLSIGVVRVDTESHLHKVFSDVTKQMDGMYMTKDGAMACLHPGETMPQGANPLRCKVRPEQLRFRCTNAALPALFVWVPF